MFGKAISYGPECTLELKLYFVDMINIFEVFLPQLLRYPNPTDPLNGEAAALLMREPAKYEAKVKGNTKKRVGLRPKLYNTPIDYVSRYATKEAADAAAEESSDEDDMSSVSYASSEDEATGMEL